MERRSRALYARITDQIAFLSRVVLPIIYFSLQIFVDDVVPLRADQRLDPPSRDRIPVERPGLALDLRQRGRPVGGSLRRHRRLAQLDERRTGEDRLLAGA